MSKASTTDPHPVPLQAGRELDALIAEKVFGMVVRRIKPDWYPYEVTLFFHPAYPDEIVYSCDENASNAMMYRNGKDASDGAAPVLPNYSDDIASAWEVVEKMAQSYDFYLRFVSAWTAEFITIGGGEIDSADSETAPEAICLAALRAIGEVR